MAIEASPTSSRRALLAGLLGGLAATAAGALGRAQPVSAGHDGTNIVHLGEANSAIAQTLITNTAMGGSAFSAQVSGSGTGVSGSSGSGTAVFGSSDSGTGVYASSGSGWGVVGSSDSNYGVYAASGSSYGVYASSGSGSTPVALGWNYGGNTGLQGYSGTDAPPASPAKTGVFGYAAQDSGARGVAGETTAGRGVQGIATSGVGGHFSAAATGTALRAEGRIDFSTSGMATVAVGTKSTTVTPGSDLVTDSRILCTLESNQAGLSIQRVTKNTTADTFKVYLSANVLSGKYANVAWFAIG